MTKFSPLLRCKIEGNCVSGLGTLFLGLIFGSELFDEQADLLGLGIRRWVFPAKIKKIPEPFPVMDVERYRDFAL
jgi:hypothetical protein